MTQSGVQSSPAESFTPTWRRGLDLVGAQNLSLLVALAILVAIFGWSQGDTFFLPRNLTNILNAVAILGLVGSAQTIVIISGAIDISVGSIVGVAGVAAAMAMVATNAPAIGISVAIAVGTVAAS